MQSNQSCMNFSPQPDCYAPPPLSAWWFHARKAARASNDVVKEDLQTNKKVERFDISLESLKMMFENPRTDVKSQSVVHVSTPRRAIAGQSRQHSVGSKDQTPPAEKMLSEKSHDLQQSAGSAGGPGTGAPEEATSQGKGAHPDPTESVSLKERLAMYQAAVSKKEAANAPGMVTEESGACSLPGGLASVKKQFESQELASSSQSTVTQYHYQQRSVQISHEQSTHESNVVSSYEDHLDGTVKVVGREELPQISTQALKQQFEKTIEEATPSKQIKIDLGFNQCEWGPAPNVSSGVSTNKSSFVTSKVEDESSVSANASLCESIEIFPPPPPDLLQVPVETPDQYCVPEPLDPSYHSKQTVLKEQYSKQRNLYELKRLYKHIHPEVRKNLEKDFLSDVTEIEGSQMNGQKEVTGDVQQARYVFENSGTSPIKSVSPEREYLEWDEILKGEVQSMRWMFENKPLDTIKDETPDEDSRKSIAQQEIIAGSDVKYTTWMFETQPIDALGTSSPDSTEHTGKMSDLARGDVRTATWLFETQPLDTLSKMYQEEDQTTESICIRDVTGGDVKTARYLFETQHLDSLGHTETIDEYHFLQLKSELETIKGDVKTTKKLFETQPLCVIRGDSGEMLEIKTICREEMEKGDVKTSRWLFETQPLDMISKDPTQVKLVCRVSMEDCFHGGVNKGRWLFETKTLDSIKDEEWESSNLEKEQIVGADVRKQCWVFETQPMDSLKDNSNARPLSTEEVVGGDVQSARHLFETVPMDALKDSPEVGKLKTIVKSEEEKGDVRHQKWLFESQPLENIREEKKEFKRTVHLEEIDKGNVTNCKEIFETMDLSKFDETQKIQVEGVTSGFVKSNKHLFESMPLYAIKDSSGYYHEVKTVRREEIVKGNVRTCKWMFETRPIDQFDESISKFQIIKGISKQEIETGDVKTAKWLFETQPLDSIKYFSNVEDQESETKEAAEVVKGDVKTCRWLFETQPIHSLNEKAEVRSETETETIQEGLVKTCTWLFETQSLDAIRDESEGVINTCTVKHEDIQGKDVRKACFLFETENLESISGEDASAFKRVTEIDIQSGDVSRMKYIFENQSSDIMTSTSEETMKKLKADQTEDIQKGNVVSCTWLFENQPIDAIHDGSKEHKEIRAVTDIQGGNVDKGRFTFETFSLDKIQGELSETETTHIQKTILEDIEKGDVKNYTMMFENQPLYAIQDKQGHYHEVKTVTKEEIMKGNVVGARWLFETKPLDSIQDTDEVYVIKAVTQEEIHKGDVSTARWRFETQPLDKISEETKVLMKTVEDIQGGDVKTNKQRFESEDLSQKYIRMVSVSEIQKGDVRSATWMFETRTIDKIQGEDSEYDEMEKVKKEEVLKGDVKHSVWLFEKQPLDKIKETDELDAVAIREEIPRADVKTTTWLFETTPFHQFSESSVEKAEIIGKSIKETLKELYSQKMVKSQGIIIEADEIGDVRMAKYKLMNQEAPEIQKEEVIRGDLKNIMMNLLKRREITERRILIDEEERGNINTAVKQLFSQEVGINVEKEEIIRGDIQEAINNLMKEDGSAKRGILIQEDEKGDVRMTIYSLLNKKEEINVSKEDIIKGNVKGTINILLSHPNNPEQYMRVKVGDTEKGNVSFYSTCIESGALDYLKGLQVGPDETASGKVEKETIVGGDIKGTKQMLQQNQLQIERTVTEDDIIPGDVHSTIKVFMTEPVVSLDNIQKEDIVKGDLRATLDSLTHAINQKKVVEREEVVKGDINTTLRSLEEAQSQSKEIEKTEIVPGDIKGALQSLEKSATRKVDIAIDDLVPGDIKGAIKSLEEAKQAVKEVEKEEIVKGDIQTVMQSLNEASSEKKIYHQQMSVQGDVKGVIQLLLEPPAPPKSQRKPSVEGGVKMSIKSLYDVQEQPNTEKEEMIKGDVQGTIKCLLKGKQHTTMKSSTGGSKKGNMPMKTSLTSQQVSHECSAETKAECETVPAVKNLSKSTELHSGMQKQTVTKSVQSKSFTKEDHSLTAQTTGVNTSHTSPQTNIKEQSLKQTIPSSEPVTRQNKNMTNQMTDNVPPHQTSNITVKHIQGLKTDALTSDVSAGLVTTNVNKKETQIKTSTKTKQSVKTGNQVTGNTEASRMNADKDATQINIAAKHARYNQKVNQMNEEVLASGMTHLRKKTSHTNVDARNSQDLKTMGQVQTSLTDHKTIVQKHDIKTLKTQFRNLDMSQKDKNLIPEMHLPPPPPSPPPLSESEFPLPPPPPPVSEPEGQLFPTPPPSVLKQDSDLPPPSPPLPPAECLKSDLDNFPLPPPPPPTGQDYLPPPPSQKELESMPALSLHSPHTKPKKMTVKPVKAPALYKVPKFEPPKQLEESQDKMQHKQTVTQPVISKKLQADTQQSVTLSESTSLPRTVRTEIHQGETTKLQAQKDFLTAPSAKVTSSIPLQSNKPLQEELPPSEKVFKPFKVPPSPDEPVPTKPKPYVTKFKTPLMIAEEKYRKQREENEKSKSGIAPTFPHSGGNVETSVNTMLDVSITQTKDQSMKNIASAVFEKEAQAKDLLLKSLTPSVNEDLGCSSDINSAYKQELISNETSLVASTKQHMTSSFSPQHQTVSSAKKQVIPVSSGQSHASDIKARPSASKIVSAAAEGHEYVLKESSASKLTSMQGISSLHTQTTATMKTNEAKLTDTAEKQEIKKVPPSATKIPKVTPSFKVKTIKIPKVEKIENFDRKDNEKKERSAEIASAQHLSQKEENDVQVQHMKDVQERTKVTASSVQKFKETSEKVEEQNQVKKVAPAKETVLEIHMMQSKQKSKMEKTDPIPKEITPSLPVKGIQEQEKIKTYRSLQGTHVPVCEEVIVTESKIQQNFQQQSTVQLQKQSKSSTKQEVEVNNQQMQKTSNDKYVPVKLTDKPSQKGTAMSSAVTENTSKQWEEVQQLLFDIKELQSPSGKINPKTVKTLLSKTPVWLINPEAKRGLENRADNNIEKLKEIVLYIQSVAQAKLPHLAGHVTIEKHESELVSEKNISGGATPKISKISIDSTKVEIQKKVLEEKKVSHERKQQEPNETRRADARVASPLIRMRSPSPTYITIESTRRTDSPQRVPSSSSPIHRSATPPNPPPRMADPPISRISRATPSPTFNRSEKLAKLKDTTAKLSQGGPPPPPPQPVQITEKKSEIVESPSSFHRQIKIETHFVETSETLLEALSVKDKKELFEEAQKADVNRTYVRKDPIDIPERLGPDTEEIEVPEKEKEELPRVNLSGLVHKFESPEQKVYTRKEPIVISERLGSDTEELDTEKDKKITQVEPVPAFNIKAIKTVFETGEQSSQVKERKHKHEKLASELHEIMADGSKQEDPWRQEKVLWQSSPPLIKREILQSELTEPMGFSGSESVGDKCSDANKFGTKANVSRSATAMSPHSGKISTRRAPPTYADVVKGNVPVLDVTSEESPEELLKNFHKTWTESESVFKSLGYSVSEQKTSQIVSHKEETLVTENSSSRVGAVCSVPEEGVSNGVFARRQTKLP
uniref:Xin actin binding repeat containing 2 n=1 Tax=Scleropages formosus TaxID=113540 RepID=A0A8C9SNE2_SCLFO